MADASHELRTPISVVRTTASVILNKSSREEEEYRRAMAVVESQARRLTRIVDDMLRLARADAGHVLLQSRLFHLDEMLLDTVQAAVVLASQKEVAIEVSELSEGPFQGDEDLLRQMVMNLLDNAVKYTPPHGKIEVSLSSQNGSYAIRVSDTGCGIPEAAQALIFERFYRVEQGRSQAAGAGLGLAIARWIAELHSGSLELERSTPQGSVFRALLPRPQVT
jgi:signal transduction histidine kinase